MQHDRTITVGLVILSLITGCANKGDTSAEDQVVIRVDDRMLTLGEYNECFAQIRMSYGSDEANDRETMRAARLRLLSQLAEEMIILRRADELDLDISPDEVDKVMGELQKDSSGEGFQYLLMKQAISLEDWKESLRKRLLVEKVIHEDLLPNVSVAPEEIKNYYENHWRESAHVETVRARHILLNNEDEANQILERLKKGEDFVTLARRHSVGPEAERGGDLGYVVRGQLPESLETPLFEVPPGALSPVVKTPFGFHIFQVIEKRERGKAKIEDCMDEIRERLMKEKLEVAYGPWLDAFRKRYHLEINKEVIS